MSAKAAAAKAEVSKVVVVSKSELVEQVAKKQGTWCALRSHLPPYASTARSPGVCTALSAGAWLPAAGAGALEESSAEARTFHRRRPELSEKEVSRVVNATLEEISNYLVAGDKVQLIGCVLRGGGGPLQLPG